MNRLKLIPRKTQVDDDDNVIAIEEERIVAPETDEGRLPRDLLIKQPYIAIRVSGPFAYKGFFLGEGYDWVMGKDEDGLITLLCLKMKEDC